MLSRALSRFGEAAVRSGVRRVRQEIGGPARRRVIVILAAILGLDSADQGAIGAVAPQLETSLHISNVQLGLLVTVSAVVGACTTLAFGTLVDRRNRVHLLAIVVAIWGIAEALSGAVSSYPMLLAVRVALGGVTAAAAPGVASLTGDLFPSAERGRLYGYIITGEMLGAGFGVLVAGLIAGWFGWRPALSLLAVPSLLVSYVLIRHLPEPARGGASWIGVSASVIPATPEAREAGDPAQSAGSRQGDVEEAPASRSTMREAIERSDAAPEPELVVDEDGSDWGLWRAMRYVLRVRTNVVMILASSIGYFFFAGLKTFALLFVRGHYHIGQGFATLLVLVIGAGAIAGVVLAGTLTDRSIANGRVTARLDMGVAGYIAGSALLVPAILTSNLLLALPLLIVAAAGIAAPNATLDAARLDVVPAKLWGRAEGARTVLRMLLEAAAPLVFGFVSVVFGSSGDGLGTVAGGAKAPAGTSAQATGIGDTFLLMLVLLAASGLILLLGRKSYPSDVASAMESERRMNAREDRRGVASHRS